MTPAARLAEYVGKDRRGKHACTLQGKRKSLGLTLATVSAELGLSLGYLSKIELGRNLPHLPVAFRLARFYGCSVEEAWPGLGGEPTEGEPC